MKDNGKRIAVALRYDGVGAPRVTAKGADATAERIMAIAQEHDIPLQQDKELVKLLQQVDLGDQIPEPLYRAVAQILAFAYMLKGKRPEA